MVWVKNVSFWRFPPQAAFSLIRDASGRFTPPDRYRLWNWLSGARTGWPKAELNVVVITGGTPQVTADAAVANNGLP